MPAAARPVLALARVCLFAIAIGVAAPAFADDPVKGTVSVFTENGYTRLLFRLDQEVPARIDVAGTIMVISFKAPVNIPVEALSASAPGYISVARRDPDGTAIRIALARKVKVNTIRAAERFYVDLLPDTWTGLTPGLPQEVIDDLARRAREAERVVQRQQGVAREKAVAPMRVKVARMPTFVRYVFPMPETTEVVPEQADGRFVLAFDQLIAWDLADAKATMPPTVEAIDVDPEVDAVKVTFALNGSPEVRTFREDRSFVVDIGTMAAGAKQAAAPVVSTPPRTASPLAIDAPETVPAGKDIVAAKDAPPGSDIVVPKGEPLRPDVPPAKNAEEKPTAPKQETIRLEAPKSAVANAPAPPPPTARGDELTLPPVVQQNAPLATPAPPPAPAQVQVPPSAPAPAAAVEPRPAPAPAVEPPPAPARSPVVEAAPAPVQAPAMAEAPPMVPKTAAPEPLKANDGTVYAAVRESKAGPLIDFPFLRPTPAAVFRRADTLWLVFDTDTKIDVTAIKTDRENGIRGATFARGKDGAAIVRIKLMRPRLVSLAADGPGWTMAIADAVTTPSAAVTMSRSILGKSQAHIAATFEGPVKLHMLRDPEVGDTLMVITGLAPARGIPKQQDFVELRALASVHGIVVQPVADDVAAQLEADRVVFGRPGGLALSPTTQAEEQIASTFRALTFDPQTWGFDREASYIERQAELIRLAAGATEAKRKQARLNLARFYLARDMGAEAKGVLDVALGEERDTNDVTGSLLHIISDIMMNRPDKALKELAVPQVAAHSEAPIWRAVAYAREGKWPQAREAFRAGEAAVPNLPIELQRLALLEAVRAMIEVRDFSAASKTMNDLEALGVPGDIEATFKALRGRLEEGLGRNDDALNDYRTAATSSDRRAAAQGRLREISLMLEKNQMPRNDVITALETLTTVWRGDETETEGLRMLAHLYTEDNRYRDAFHVMRTALMAHPNSDMTRKIQDEAAATFDSLFLEGKGDMLPPVEALGLFYDYRELTPIGRRGDEMIRRLADRLVSVDLLDQAAELLQHQVDNRLQGAARAQVATRLAVVYLMNRKPDRALTTLQKTRSADLANELREQRLLLEARALSDLSRHDLAVELIALLKGQEAIRLRADILWSAKKWRQSAEQIELLYGLRWRDFAPLTDGERTDILRAAIGYSLGDEPIGLARLREKYAAKMADGPDGQAFAAVTSSDNTNAIEFQDVAKRIAGIDTLQQFLRDVRRRYPDSAPPMPFSDKESNGKPDTAVTNSIGGKKTESWILPPKPPAGVPVRPDPAATGSIRNQAVMPRNATR